jgi:hypothetical protein
MLASVVIGIVVGSGIFLVPADMMQAAGSFFEDFE